MSLKDFVNKTKHFKEAFDYFQGKSHCKALLDGAAATSIYNLAENNEIQGLIAKQG